MELNVQAIYENGVLRPLQPLNLGEREVVSLSIQREPSVSSTSMDECLDIEALRHSKVMADPKVSLTDVREALAGIQGELADAVSQQRGDY
jgi:predicted DNA-binding antitoxin AbrB/MazE fold protein